MRFIVNHGGVVHAVNDEHFALHLGLASKPATPENPAGAPAREATSDEVIAYFARQGLIYDPVANEARPKPENPEVAPEAPAPAKASK